MLITISYIGVDVYYPDEYHLRELLEIKHMVGEMAWHVRDATKDYLFRLTYVRRSHQC